MMPVPPLPCSGQVDVRYADEMGSRSGPETLKLVKTGRSAARIALGDRGVEVMGVGDSEYTGMQECV
eukprot:COSAG01_NODE_18121_length_1099_cov_1.694000_1_plen_67_part_00